MSNSDNSSQSPFDQYLVPLAVCVPVCVAAFFYMKNSMSVSELPPIDTSSSSSDSKSKKSKKPKKKPVKKEVVVEEVVEEVEEEVEEEPAAEEKTAAPKKKTGAQKRKEKKAKEEAEKKEAAKAEKKKGGDSGKKKAPEKTASKQKVVEDEWNVVSDDKKVKGNSAQPEPAAEEAKPVVSEKQNKKAAKARAEKQRENAKKNDTAYLDNLPEEIKAQLAKFNAPAATPVTAAVINDEWTDIAVKTTTKPKKSVVEVEETEEATSAEPVKKSRPQKVTIYKNASQSEIFKPVGERKDDEFSKYSFKGLEASW